MSRTTTPPAKTKAKPKPAAAHAPAKPAPKPSGVSKWVKAFVAFHVIAITIWCIPDPPTALRGGRIKWQLHTDNLPNFAQSLNDGFRVFAFTKLKPSAVKYYLLPTGFWQYWDMFAPNPANIDFYCDADVTYQDGTHRTYLYPRMYSLGLLQKYGMERFRKYYERARDEVNYQYTWPAFAQRIALLSTTDPKNPAVEVRLRRHFREVLPPDKPQPTEYGSVEYFPYRVNQTKLQIDLQGGE